MSSQHSIHPSLKYSIHPLNTQPLCTTPNVHSTTQLSCPHSTYHHTLYTQLALNNTQYYIYTYWYSEHPTLHTPPHTQYTSLHSINTPHPALEYTGTQIYSTGAPSLFISPPLTQLSVAQHKNCRFIRESFRGQGKGSILLSSSSFMSILLISQSHLMVWNINESVDTGSSTCVENNAIPLPNEDKILPDNMQLFF